MHNRTFSKLSEFYIELWSHLDGFFDDNRWLRVSPDPILSIEERIASSTARFETLYDSLEEPTLAAQIKKDMEDVDGLTKEYLKHRPEPGTEWFKRADKMRDYVQKLGLRYGEMMAAEYVRG